jgi:6-pyruvoyl-tetrahydropterin synthase
MHPVDHTYKVFVKIFEEAEQRSKASYTIDANKVKNEKPRTARAKSLNNALEHIEIIDVHPEKT